MGEYQFLLLLVLMCVKTNGQLMKRNTRPQNRAISRDRSGEIVQINRKMEELTRQSNELKIKKTEVTQKLQQLKVNCAQELDKIENEYQTMMRKSEEGNQLLSDLMKKIQEEEEEHIKLEAELKRISDIMELLLLQHQIFHTDFQLREKRHNESANHCKEVLKKLVASEEHFQARSALTPYKIRRRAMNERDRNVMTLRRRLQTNQQLYTKLKKDVELAQMELETEANACRVNKENKQNQFKDTASMLQTQEKSIKLLKKDLNDAIKISESLRLTSQKGKNYINELDDRNEQIRNALKDLLSDTQCFNQIKEME